jgi:hypothetical protein
MVGLRGVGKNVLLDRCDTPCGYPDSTDRNRDAIAAGCCTQLRQVLRLSRASRLAFAERALRALAGFGSRSRSSTKTLKSVDFELELGPPTTAISSTTFRR